MLSELRRNALEVLISPRVRALPQSRLLTVLTHLFLLAGSILAALLLAWLSSAKLCQALPWAQSLDQGQSDCKVLQLRRELVSELVVNANDLLIHSFTSTQTVGLQLEAANPQSLSPDLRELRLAASVMEPLAEALLLLTKLSSVLGKPEGRTSKSNFVRALRSRIGSNPNIQLRTVPLGSVPDEDLTFFTTMKHGRLPDENRSFALNVDAYTLAMTFNTDGGLNCVSKMDFEAGWEPRASFISGCVAIAASNGTTPSLRLSYSSPRSVGGKNLALSVLRYLQNIHGPIHRLDESAFRMLENVFSSVFFTCCKQDSLDVVEYVGIISGFMFLFEGGFLFIFALIHSTRMDKRRQLSAKAELVDPSGSFAYSLNDQTVREIIVKESIVKAEAVQTTKVHSVRFCQLMQVVFNPRCRSIPYASFISLVSLGALVGASWVLAVWYQDLRAVLVCEPTLLKSTQTSSSSCGSLKTSMVYYPRLDVRSKAISPQLNTRISIDATELSTFDVKEVLNEDVVQGFQGCSGLGFTECLAEAKKAIVLTLPTAVAIINKQAEPHFRSSLTILIVLPRGDNRAILFISASLVNPTNSTRDARLKVTWSYRLDEVISQRESGFSQPVPLVDYSTDFKTDFLGRHRSLDPNTDGGEILKAIIERMGSYEGAKQLLVKSIEDEFVQCCKVASLEFYDYLGLMMGYVVLLEGLLTFFCAACFYAIVLISAKFCRLLRSSTRREKSLSLI